MPLMSMNIAFTDAQTRMEPHFGALSAALDFSELVTIEAGVGSLVSVNEGESPIDFNLELRARAGVIPVLFRSRPRGEGGWVLQLTSMVGYRYLVRSNIVFEDYGKGYEHIHGVALDAGPEMTFWSAPRFGFAMRLLVGGILPLAREISSDFPNYPYHTDDELRAAVHLGFEVGVAF
jgi:hypothetical protein